MPKKPYKHIALLEYLREHPEGRTTWQISQDTYDCAVHTTVNDLMKYARRNNLPLCVKCEYKGINDNGRRIFLYTLIEDKK